MRLRLDALALPRAAASCTLCGCPAQKPCRRDPEIRTTSIEAAQGPAAGRESVARASFRGFNAVPIRRPSPRRTRRRAGPMSRSSRGMTSVDEGGERRQRRMRTSSSDRPTKRKSVQALEANQSRVQNQAMTEHQDIATARRRRKHCTTLALTASTMSPTVPARHVTVPRLMDAGVQRGGTGTEDLAAVLVPELRGSRYGVDRRQACGCGGCRASRQNPMKISML